MSATREKLQHLLDRLPAGGASLSLWKQGKECYTLCAGEGWNADSLVPIFSATKVVGAACILDALYKRGLTEQCPLGEIWPCFPLPYASIAQLLSYQLGLAYLAWQPEYSQLDECQRAVEQSSPAWQPPQHGYHPQSIGPIMDIIMRQLTGERICTYWEREWRAPLGLDLYLGELSPEIYPRIKKLRPPRIQDSIADSDKEFYRLYQQTDSPVHRAFHAIRGLESVRAFNQETAWHSGDPARGGIASARGLAAFYQQLLQREELLPALCQQQSEGYDMIMRRETSFSCGAMVKAEDCIPERGFGHAGAGGAHGCAETGQGYSFAYVMNQMEWGVLPQPRVREMMRLAMSQ